MEYLLEMVFSRSLEARWLFEGHPDNNLYYLKGSMVTGQVATSISLDDDYTRI